MAEFTTYHTPHRKQPKRGTCHSKSPVQEPDRIDPRFQRFIGIAKTSFYSDQRGRAAERLGEIGDIRAVPLLVDMVGKEYSHSVCTSAMTALARFGGGQARVAIEKRLELEIFKFCYSKRVNHYTCFNIIESALKALSKIKDSESVPSLQHCLRRTIDGPAGHNQSKLINDISIALLRFGEAGQAALNDLIPDEKGSVSEIIEQAITKKEGISFAMIFLSHGSDQKTDILDIQEVTEALQESSETPNEMASESPTTDDKRQFELDCEGTIFERLHLTNENEYNQLLNSFLEACDESSQCFEKSNCTSAMWHLVRGWMASNMPGLHPYTPKIIETLGKLGDKRAARLLTNELKRDDKRLSEISGITKERLMQIRRKYLIRKIAIVKALANIKRRHPADVCAKDLGLKKSENDKPELADALSRRYGVGLPLILGDLIETTVNESPRVRETIFLTLRELSIDTDGIFMHAYLNLLYRRYVQEDNAKTRSKIASLIRLLVEDCWTREELEHFQVAWDATLEGLDVSSRVSKGALSQFNKRILNLAKKRYDELNDMYWRDQTF